ncbi:MAG: hypothetical protein OEV87_02665 [Phycisphaerae bacterium]|nr:hypothetical protein [Phycisphaerae bacterium]
MNTTNDKPQKKLCVITLILIIFTVVSITLLMTLMGRHGLGMQSELLLEDILYGLLVMIPLLAVASLIRISLNGHRLIGRTACWVTLVFACFFLYLMAYSEIVTIHNYF